MAALMASLALSPEIAVAQTRNLDIPPQPLDKALFAYSSQSGRQVIYDSGVISDKKSAAVKGVFTPQHGLQRLLMGTGIRFRMRASGVAVLYAVSEVELPLPTTPPPVSAPVVEPEPLVVIVTATKRPRNLQRIPMAVSQVKARSLEMSGSEQIEELSKVVPALTVIQGDTPANSAYSLRGIGTVAYSISAEPSVLVQVDDVPAMFQARSFMDMTDVDRIEILRGPQNTLYGRSASGGAVNIMTAGPTKEFTASLTNVMTSDEERRVSFHTSGPTAHDLYFRVAVNLGDYAGSVRNLTLNKTVNGYASQSLRTKLLWSPSRQTQALLTAWYSHNRTTCCAYALYEIPDGATLNPDGGPVEEGQDVFLKDIMPGEHNRTLHQDTRTFADLLDGGASLKFDHIFGGGFRFSSVSTVTDFRMRDQIDSDGGVIPNYATRQISAGRLSQSDYDRLLNVEPQFANFTTQGNVHFGTYHASGKTQEFRLLSPADPFRYMVGVFFSDHEVSLESARGPAFRQHRWNALATNRDADLFGQIDWTFQPRNSLSVGARSQHKTIGYRFDDLLAGASFSGQHTETANSYRASLQHTSDQDDTLYVALVTGFKGAAFDLTSGFNQDRADRGPARPETTKSIEAGWRVRNTKGDYANLSVFRVDYENFQSQAADYDASTDFLTNIDEVRTQGVEFDAFRRMSPDWRLTLAGHYLDAKVVKYTGAPCYPGQTVAEGCSGAPGRQNLSGRQLPYAPRWKFNVMSDNHFRPDPNHWLVVSSVYRWQSATLMSMNQDPRARQKSFGILDLSAGLHDRGGKYSVTAFVNNVFDTFYVAARQSDGRTNSMSVVQIPARDSARYVGVRMTFSH
jgi:iron complex outermembrane receptor protein